MAQPADAPPVNGTQKAQSIPSLTVKSPSPCGWFADQTNTVLSPAWAACLMSRSLGRKSTPVRARRSQWRIDTGFKVPGSTVNVEEDLSDFEPLTFNFEPISTTATALARSTPDRSILTSRTSISCSLAEPEMM